MTSPVLANSEQGQGPVADKAEGLGGVESRGAETETTTTGPIKTVHDIDSGDGEAEADLLGWDDLALWQQHNHFILTGHRRARASHMASLRSVFKWHNETVNIWAHVLGTVIFAGVGVGFWLRCDRGRVGDRDQGDVQAVLVYFAGCVVCFAVSSVYHTSLDHSPSVRTVTCRLDFLSILLPLLGTTLCATHFGLSPTAPHLALLYSRLAIVFTLLCALVTLHPRFSSPAGHVVRTAMYCALGAASFAPIVHGVVKYGWEMYGARMGLRWYLGLACCHAVGAAVYAVKWPERWWPRRFDLMGSSHQIMHVAVVMGAACYGVGVLRAFESVGKSGA